MTRDEVASFANVSVDWYTRIEQGRIGASPSLDVLKNLCEVLKLDPSETEYVFNLVGLIPPFSIDTTISSTTIDLINKQMPNPTFVMDNQFNILKTNQSYQKVFGTPDIQSSFSKNWIWWSINDVKFQHELSNWNHYVEYATAVFRQKYSKNTDSKLLYSIFNSIKDNPIFKKSWDSLQISNFKTQYLILNSSKYGELYLIENVLEVPSTNQYLVLHNPGDDTTLNKLKHISNE